MANVPDIYKECRSCHTSVRLEDFIKDSRNKDGHGSWCKDCKNKKNVEWAKANPKTVAKISKKWREANLDKVAKLKAEYRSNPKNKKAELEQKRIWASNNKDKIRLYSSNRRANKRNSDKALVTDTDFSNLYLQPCAYCGAKAEQIDHIIPLARGGRHAIGNLAPSCTKCNQSKGSKLLIEWKYKVRYN
jgi:5-methylcytosine-specific restriction endonuclease McrA